LLWWLNITSTWLTIVFIECAINPLPREFTRQVLPFTVIASSLVMYDIDTQ
jgi:hypothetical protein